MSDPVSIDVAANIRNASPQVRRFYRLARDVFDRYDANIAAVIAVQAFGGADLTLTRPTATAAPATRDVTAILTLPPEVAS